MLYCLIDKKRSNIPKNTYLKAFKDNLFNIKNFVYIKVRLWNKNLNGFDCYTQFFR